MGTKADVDIFGKTFVVQSDGQPESTGPLLKNFADDARSYAKKHRFTFKEACNLLAILETQENYGLFICQRYSGYSPYGYRVTPQGIFFKKNWATKPRWKKLDKDGCPPGTHKVLDFCKENKVNKKRK